jgi:hypothetical protein
VYLLSSRLRLRTTTLEGVVLEDLFFMEAEVASVSFDKALSEYSPGQKIKLVSLDGFQKADTDLGFSGYFIQTDSPQFPFPSEIRSKGQGEWSPLLQTPQFY